jgi:predicted permease
VSKTDVNEVLKEGGRTGTAGRRARWWTSALLVSELALTLVLLAGAGYMMRSFLALSSFDLGIDTSPLVTARVSLPNRKYPGNDQRVAFFQRLEERLNTIGGVEGAAVVSNPPGMGGGRRPFAIEGAPPTEAGETASRVTTVLVGPRYFDALGLGVIRGRALLETDGLPGQENVVVNKEFAETHFRGQDPLGQRFGFKNENEPPKTWMTIVGVVPNVRQRGMGPGLGDPGESNQPELVAYLPHRTNPGLGAAIVLRTRSNLGSLAPFLRSEMRTVDPELPLDEIRTLDESLARQRWPYSVFGSMFAFFAFVALLLSAVGLYAITAYSVTQRTQEIGVRMALGAQPTDVWWLVMRRALVHLSIGVTIGLAGAYGVGVLLQGFLVGSTPADPITLGAIALVLIGVALAACFAPARKATSLDPLAALRYE